MGWGSSVPNGEYRAREPYVVSGQSRPRASADDSVRNIPSQLTLDPPSEPPCEACVSRQRPGRLLRFREVPDTKTLHERTYGRTAEIDPKRRVFRNHESESCKVALGGCGELLLAIGGGTFGALRSVPQPVADRFPHDYGSTGLEGR